MCSSDLEKIKLDKKEADFILINVYYPNFPTLVTGQIVPVRKEMVMKVGNPSREIIDLFLFAIRSPEHIQFLPWEDEIEEEFLKRAKIFGLNVSTG